MKKTVFTKYSNDRDKNYKIRTDILEDERGNRYARKLGLSPEGQEHIKNMFNVYLESDEQMAKTRFELNKSVLNGDVLELEYVKGESLEGILDGYLARGEREKFIQTVELYGTEIRNMAVHDFVPCREYFEVFGQGAETDLTGKSMLPSNIDMIFANIIVRGQKWVVLDYEWTLPIPVPVDFVLYRAAHYYALPSRAHDLGDIDLCGILGISEDKCRIYSEMEKNFQHYIYHENKPLWKLYETMGRESYFPLGMVEHQAGEKRLRGIQVLKDFGNGFRGLSDYMYPEPNAEGNIIFDIDVEEGIRTIRIDPAERKCILYVNSIVGMGKEEYRIQYGSNGISTDNKLMCFDSNDPQILIGDFRPGLTRIHVDFNIEYVNDMMIEHVKGMLNGYNDLRCSNLEKIEALSASEARVDSLNGELDAMRNSTSWRLTKPIRSVGNFVRGRSEG